MNSSDATPKASPGGSASAFCDPVSAKPNPHSSTRSSAPPAPVTLSTRQSAPCSRAAAATARTSVSAPVDDSECTTVTAA
jgi:hypothetical protein